MTFLIKIHDDCRASQKRRYDLDDALDAADFKKIYGEDCYKSVIYLYPGESLSFTCLERVDEE